MNNITGSAKGYIDETKVVKTTVSKEIKKDKSNKEDIDKLTKSISEDYFKLLEKCEQLYDLKSVKEFYDLSITINSAKKDILKLNNI